MYDINILLKLEQVTDRERSGAVRRNRGPAEGVRARPEGARSPEGGVMEDGGLMVLGLREGV